MFQNMLRQIALCGAATLISSTAFAQFFPGSSFDPCAPARPVAMTAAVPQQCVMTCQPAPLVPVAQTCYQTVPVTEFHLAPGAVVKHIRLQEESRDGRHIALQTSRQGRDSRLESVALNVGAALSRTNIDAELTKATSRTTSYCWRSISPSSKPV